MAKDIFAMFAGVTGAPSTSLPALGIVSTIFFKQILSHVIMQWYLFIVLIPFSQVAADI